MSALKNRVGTLALALCSAAMMVAVMSSTTQASLPAPKTVAGCKKRYPHNSKERLKCIHRVEASSKTSCSLETKLVGGLEEGDKKDFGVAATEEGSNIRIVVKVHNPKIIICSAAVTFLNYTGGLETDSTGTHPKEVTYPATISQHGGTSSPVLWAEPETVPIIKVRARVGS